LSLFCVLCLMLSVSAKFVFVLCLVSNVVCVC
jgi:hypothetical protein